MAIIEVQTLNNTYHACDHVHVHVHDHGRGHDGGGDHDHDHDHGQYGPP